MAPKEYDRPLVSVVIPTYNRPTLLADAVESVLEQTYDRIEIVIVDDGSTTHPETALEDAQLPLDGASSTRVVAIRVLNHDVNLGANVARNTGISASQGDYVAFLDDDDYWLSTKIERQVTVLENASDDVGIVFTGQRYVDRTETVTDIVRPKTEGDFTANLAQGADFGPFSTVMVRAEVFDRAGYPDEQFPCWQDREWYFRLATEYDYVSIPAPLTVRRFTDSPQISDQYEAKRDTAYPLLIEKHEQCVAALGRRYERQFRGELSRALGHDALVTGQYLESIRYLLRSLRYRPAVPSTYAYLLAALGGPYTYRLARVCNRTLTRLRNRLPGLESDAEVSGDDPRQPSTRPTPESHR